jgi:hypothetical protein
MPVLSFLCPTTRDYFDSGIRIDESSAAASRLKIVKVSCPHCRREHRFLLADGVFDGAGQADSARVDSAWTAKKPPLRKTSRRTSGMSLHGALPAEEHASL